VLYEYCVKVYAPGDSERSLATYQLEANGLAIVGWEPILNAVCQGPFPGMPKNVSEVLIVTYRRAARTEPPRVSAAAAPKQIEEEPLPEELTEGPDTDDSGYHFKL